MTARCVICGAEPPDPKNLLDVCQRCAEHLDTTDRDWLNDRPQTRPRLSNLTRGRR